MSSLSVGDLAQYLSLSRSGSALTASLQRLSGEVVSGLADDRAAHLSGDFGPLAGIQTSLARLSGYRAVTSEATLMTSAMQSALGKMTDDTTDLAKSLLAGSTPGTPTRIAALGTEAAQVFSATVSSLNAQVGDRSLFAGVATTNKPLPDGSALLDTLQAVASTATDAAGVQTAIDAWFADPAGFAASYGGGDPLAPLPLGAGETVQIGITAVDPAIVDTLRGLALSAMVDRGLLSGSNDAQADLFLRSGEVLLAAPTGLGVLSARLGIAQARIEEAESRNGAETSALEMARSDLLSIDSYDSAARLKQTQVQLETLYTLTSRLSRLNLVNFL